MKVLKFGGTSVGKPANLKTIFKVISHEHGKGNAVAAVFSALSGITDQLIDTSNLAAKKDLAYKTVLDRIRSRHFQFIDPLFSFDQKTELIDELDQLFDELNKIVHGIYLLSELSPRSLDQIMSFGERLSNTIIAAYGKSLGLPIVLTDTRKIIVTDDSYGSARVDLKTTNRNIRRHFENSANVHIITGFIAATTDGITTTLGRGGSDFTASLFAATLKAEEVQIWTDVNGVMSADPGKVKEAFPLNELSYEEAMELSHFGAKVLHPPTIQPAMDKNIPVRIMNTFNSEFPGTLIKRNPTGNGSYVKGITSISNISLLTIQGSGMVGVSGVSSRLFGALANAKVNVILISQASSEHSICVAINPDSVEKARTAIETEFVLEIQAHLVNPVAVENELTIIAAVGERMRHTTGLAGKLFGALGEKEINVIAIAQGSSELNISVVIEKKSEIRALNSIHDAFFAQHTVLNLFIWGTGLIGSTLLRQIRENHRNLLNDYALNLKVIGLANIDRMLINESGIDLDTWEEQLQLSSMPTNLTILLNEIKQLNLGNNVFVDCTASQTVVGFYKALFATRASVVTVNKIGNTGSFAQYQKFLSTARDHNVHYLYETTAGAALPIIGTLRDLVNSGDRILKIEAILSGTISFIFNNFKPGKKFSTIVKEAKRKGYTEPDPRNDLNGIDFARKLLILAREIGKPIELEDIDLEPILPEACHKAKTVQSFFSELKKADPYFTDLCKKAHQKGKVLRYIALLNKNTTAIKLKAVNSTHPFYSLGGSDNIIAITTQRYRDNPLVFKGAGAGAEVTAAGVMADIFKIANSVIKKRIF